MNDADGQREGAASATTDAERLQAAWLEWVRANLGRDPMRAEAAAKAASEVMASGGGLNDAYDAANSTWRSIQIAGGDHPDSETTPPLTTAEVFEFAAPTVYRILLSIGVAYAGLVVAFGMLGALNTPEYEHVSYLHMGLIFLAWSIVAILGVAV